MKYFIYSLIIFSTLLLESCNKNLDYEKIAKYQDDSVPELDVITNDSTKVLVVVPHADDETIAGGLITFFKEKGALINLLLLCEHDETRVNEINCATSNLGIENIKIAGFINNTWEDIMKDSITFWYDQKDSIKHVIKNEIELFKPNYIITYDSEIGGYGHPEHRISAELTEEIFNENINNAEFSPKKIFQFTLPDKLENFLVSQTPGYKFSRKLTRSKGLPKPDVKLDIQNYWDIKNKAAHCHHSQLKILKRFHMVYEPENEKEHKKAFSKEYYKIVK